MLKGSSKLLGSMYVNSVKYGLSDMGYIWLWPLNFTYIRLLHELHSHTNYSHSFRAIPICFLNHILYIIGRSSLDIRTMSTSSQIPREVDIVVAGGTFSFAPVFNMLAILILSRGDDWHCRSLKASQSGPYSINPRTRTRTRCSWQPSNRQSGTFHHKYFTWIQNSYILHRRTI